MKRLYLIIIFLLEGILIFSQPSQTFQWGVKAGGTGEDKVAGITSLGDNFFIAGRFENQFTSGNQTVDGNKQGIYIARLDNKGNTDWVRTLIGDPMNNATRITSTKENILVGGISQGTIKVEKSAFTSDGQALFVSSWNDKGKIQWLTQYPYQGFATLDALENTPQGNILAGGMFQGTMKPAGFEQTSITEKRAYLMMLSAEGKPQKLWMSEGKGSHRLVSASTADDGNRYLLFSITGDFGFGGIPAKETPRQMEYGLTLVKTNPAGEALWIKYIPGTGFVEGIKVLAMPSGEPLVCANYTNKVTVNDTIMGADGYMATALWLFSADGRLKKSHTLTSPVAVRTLDVLFAHNGNILMTGYFRQEYASSNLNVKSKLSYGDIFLLQTDDQLAEVWHDEPAEEAFSYGKAFTLDRSGNIVLTGAFNSKLDFRGQRLESSGGDDILVAKYYNCLQKKATITGNTMLCEGGKTTLSVSGDFSAYLWNGQWGQSDLTVKQPGVYTVLAYDKTGCAAADTAAVKTIQKNSLGLPVSVTIGPSQPVLLSATEGFTQYRWSDGETTPEREVVYNDKCDSLYLSLQAFSAEGCEARDSVKVKFAHVSTQGSNKQAPGTGIYRNLSVKSWPNPVVDKLYWSISENVEYDVSLYEEKGGALYRSNVKNYLGGSVQTIDMTKMISGVYLLTIRIDGMVTIFKIVKK